MGRINERQSNYSYVYAKRQNVVLDDYGMSFLINTGIWLVSLDCLNAWIIDGICNNNVASDVLGHDHLRAIIEQFRNVKDGITTSS